MKKFAVLVLLAFAVVAGYGLYRANQPLTPPGSASIAFEIKPNSGVRNSGRQIYEAGVPLNPWLFEALARLSGKGAKLKAGSYELKAGTTPRQLIDQLVRGEFAQESLAIIEGWTFRQMREAIAAHPGLKHDSASLSDTELISRIAPDYKQPEGLFFPDTYRFAKGASDYQVYRQAHTQLLQRLNQAWAARTAGLPYQSPYDALIMASIVEKETGNPADRALIAGVFINRLKLGMPLQTDPSVIYGMGSAYQGSIHKKDLQADTPYNTYVHLGLPPTPIALPGAAALSAALQPAKTDALYFVSRGDGTSQFSSTLTDHNRAVDRYQR